jgi:DNA-binding NtrC family response regulator
MAGSLAQGTRPLEGLRLLGRGSTAVRTVPRSNELTQNIDDSVVDAGGRAPTPGLVTVFTSGRACVNPIFAGRPSFTLGRVADDGIHALADDTVSRTHAEITFADDKLRVRDLGSRNGTFVDGARVNDQTYAPYPKVIRLGQALLLPVADVAPYAHFGVEVSGAEVIGHALGLARERAQRAARNGDCVLLTGPSGVGKELAARAYHIATGRKGPFVAVNCAAIPSGLAERLLFGAKRGAFSGADTDAEGYVVAANGGTLFLDEVGDLDLSVQPKLLRMLEQQEVLELGAARPRKVDVRVCVATLKDLRGEVSARRFREDLYYRVGRPEVRIPPLTERLEEIPWIIESELKRLDARLHGTASLVEASILRPWPGNVRELIAELRDAARAALHVDRTAVSGQDFARDAGMMLPLAASTDSGAASAADAAAAASPGVRERAAANASASPPPNATGSGGKTAGTGTTRPVPIGPQTGARASFTDDEIRLALQTNEGNVLAAARALGVHRNRVRRWLVRHKLEARAFGGEASIEDEPEDPRSDSGDDNDET